MSISKKEVEHVANLSRLELTEEEKELYTQQMNNILKFAEKLDELDTSEVKPTSHALDIQNVFREDVMEESVPNDVALKNAPDKKNGQFRVLSVMES